MSKLIGALLLAVAVFMFIGYLGADVSGPAAIGALIVGVIAPAVGGIALLRAGASGGSIFGGTGRRQLGERREELRRETLQAELLRLARQHGGRLTVVEAVTELATSPEEAKEMLDALAIRGLADFEVTDSGIVVYVFHDLQRLDDKHRSKGLLE